jgi:hypothetical protein
MGIDVVEKCVAHSPLQIILKFGKNLIPFNKIKALLKKYNYQILKKKKQWEILYYLPS